MSVKCVSICLVSFCQHTNLCMCVFVKKYIFLEIHDYDYHGKYNTTYFSHLIYRLDSFWANFKNQMESFHYQTHWCKTNAVHVNTIMKQTKKKSQNWKLDNNLKQPKRYIRMVQEKHSRQQLVFMYLFMSQSEHYDVNTGWIITTLFLRPHSLPRTLHTCWKYTCTMRTCGLYIHPWVPLPAHLCLITDPTPLSQATFQAST